MAKTRRLVMHNDRRLTIDEAQAVLGLIDASKNEAAIAAGEKIRASLAEAIKASPKAYLIGNTGGRRPVRVKRRDLPRGVIGRIGSGIEQQQTPNGKEA